ncbi:phasin family protein [Pseudomonas versuta]|uniref:Poly(3-hydroxyalkanoate) granule-associated protein PhaF n=1 Tax=Pseudomonas versuta TaxID=1788301 RepID=A0A0M4QBY3_9PSED|nr:phasin family protein [Pseudomonas versuta]ALE90092.1 poly(3-hydroxyalkanoate) granule-associated protein PhaF [Pseudomonas versuta]OKA20961.1 poly(3-hydroxyalkanoate) granule-associated protein PhaF [Pseudomonas versuta]OKA25532.1 poly(3-hydroxyalkanoate) granule-associated protein PhaF [Pseudomonas versuta]
MAAKKPTAKESNSWVGKVEEYSRKIWLAGLGVYSKIDTDGSKLFDTLVKDGEKAEKLSKAAVAKLADGAKSTTSSARTRVEDVKDLALGKWSEFEEAFDKRLNNAISRLGVPSREEVKALHTKVETLTKHIEKLTAAAAKVAATKPSAASKPAPAKAAAKPVAKTAAAKPAVKAVAKPAARTTAKPATKPAVKPAAKPATAASKPAAKPAAAKSVAAKPSAKKPVAAKKPAAAKPPVTAPEAKPEATV